MKATQMTRRTVLRVGGAFVFAGAAGRALAETPGNPCGGAIAYRRSQRGRRGASQAGRRHAANRIYPTVQAALSDPAHPGDKAKVVPIVISCKLFDAWFGDGRTVVDLRRHYGTNTQRPPELIHIMNGIGAAFPGGSPDTFVSPHGQDVPLTGFTLRSTEDLELIDVTPTYTGPGPAPTVAANGLENLGHGRHRVHLDRPVAPGHWLKLALRVVGRSSGLAARMCVWVAHQPCNVNQDEQVSMADATAFGREWKGLRRPALLNMNGDQSSNGQPEVNLADVTAFGAHWNGTADGSIQRWQGTSLPAKPL